MAFLNNLSETLSSGDPTLLKWFLVRNTYLPFISSFLYVLFVKRIGPDLMKNRKPFQLRRPMIVYNFAIVFTYSISLLIVGSMLFREDVVEQICRPTEIKENHYTYWVGIAAWLIYGLKYVEFADTIFFVLRKKQHLITNLHVIHHAALPIICWVFIRTERNGLQFFPAGLNSFVHIIMYSYYGLAAMGPKYQKYLWWKEYLTKLQMVQFVLIIFFVLVVIPLSGCTTADHSIYIELFFAVMFLALFYNFYVKTYKQARQTKKKAQKVTANGHKKSAVCCNGDEDYTPPGSAWEQYLRKRCEAF